MSDNTASNLGTGQGIFAQKVGDDLQFKGLVGGTNVTLTADANNITITASNDTTGLNLGTGNGLFTSKSGDNLQLKSIIANAASGISVTSNTNDLTFQLVTANVDAGKLGGVVATDFLQKSDNLNSVANKATARTNLDVYSKGEIDANTLKNNANQLPDTDSQYSLGSNSYKWLNIYADNFYGRATLAGSLEALANINDVDLTGAANNDVIKYNSSSTNWETGTLSLLNLSDTPANYTGAANKFLQVNSSGNGVEFASGVATEAYVQSQITNLVGGAPGALDTLNELAEALNDDADFSTTITNSLAGKENTITAGTNAQYFRGDKSFQTLDTDVVPEGSSNKYLTAGNMGTISIDALSDVRTTGSNAPSDAQALIWDNIGGYWKPGTVSGGGGGGSGDIEGVVAGTGLTGGGSTGTVTLNVDVGTAAGKIVQLDGSARLPAVSGALITGINTDNITEGSSNLFYTDTRFDTRLASKSTTNLTEGANLYYTDARVNTRVNALGKANWDTAYGWGDHGSAGYLTSVPAQSFASLTGKPTTIAGYGITDLNAQIDAHLNQSNPTSGYVLSWNGSDYAWVAQSGGGAGDITSVVAGTGLTGGATSGDATLNVDVGTTAGKIVQLDGSGRLPSVDGSQLTGVSTTTSFTGLTDTPANYTGHANKLVRVNGAGNALEFIANNIPADTDGLTEGSSNLYFTNARSDARFDTKLAAADTDALSEGSSNLYHTNARSIAAVQGTNLNMGSNNITTTGKILYSNVYANLVDLPSAATYHGMFAHVHATGKGYFAHGGAWIELANHSQLANSANWDTAYGWGNHASAGYLTSVPAQSFASLTGKPTTIAGYGITDAFSGAYADLSGKPTLFDNTAFDNRLATKTTANLTEGSNLYFTNARADARITNAIKDEDNMASNSATHVPSQQSVKAYVDAQILTKDNTDEIAEGSTNLYFTDARARAAISEASAQLSYNNSTGVLTFTQGDTDTVSEGSSNLYYTSARANADFDTRLATKSTTNLSEGTNLYYTDARADARITNALVDEDNMASNSATKIPSQQSVKAYVDSQVASENELSEMNDVTISAVGNNHFIKYNASTSKWENASVAPATAAGNNTEVQFNDGGVMGSDPGLVYNKTTNDLTVSGKILYSNVYSAEGDLPSAATYHGMFAHVHGTGKGYFAHGGAWRKLLDETSSTTTNLAEGTNLYYTNARADGRIALQVGANLDLSSKDTGDLTEGSNLYYTDARADARITNALIDEDNMSSNSATKLPSQQSVKAYVDAQVAGKDNTDEITEGSTNLYFTNARAQAVSINNVVEDTTPQLGGTLDANGNTIDMGTNVITDTKVGYWDTAYGWGNHASAGYQTSAGLNAAIDSHLNQSNPTSGYVLSWNGSDYAWVTNAGYTNTDFDNRLATKTTDNLTEGSSNLYYTDARADTRATLRIGAANLSALNDVNNATPTDGQVLTWDNSNSYWKPATASGGGGTFGLAANTGSHTFNTATETLTFLGTTGQINAGIAANNVTLSLDPNINSITSISFEGSTADNNETKLQAVDPTADRTINLPDASGHLAVFATASPAAITDGTNGQALVTDGNGQLSFTTISGGSSLTVQDEGSALSTAATTLNFVGAGVTASGTGATKTITIAGGGGSGGTEYEEFKINYATNGNIQSISNTSSGISGVNIDSAAGGDLTITFTGYTTPPLTMMFYGYVYSQNKYVLNSMGTTGTTLREIPGGGSAGSPTAFGSFSTMTIKAREAETGAARSFGTVTHSWVRFVMGA